MLESETGCTLAWRSIPSSPVGAGGKRRHPRGDENTGLGANSQKLNELLTHGVADGDARAKLLKLAVRKMVEEALEVEVSEALGRGYCENGAEPGRGYRNGHRRGRLRTAEGAIEYRVPQVADRAEPFVSRVRAGLAGRTAELEQLALEMYARGLSTRDIEAALTRASRTCAFRFAIAGTTNLVEWLFREERRRTKIIPHAFGERPVLKLMYAAVIRAADRWRGIQVGEFEQRQLRAMREELNRAHARRIAPALAPIKPLIVHKLRK